MSRTYFGLKVYDDRLVKLEDIKKLPFYEFWEESSTGSSLPVKGSEVFV